MSQIVVSSYVGARMMAWVNSWRTPPTSSGCWVNHCLERKTAVPLVHAAPGPWCSTWTVMVGISSAPIRAAMSAAYRS